MVGGESLASTSSMSLVNTNIITGIASVIVEKSEPLKKNPCDKGVLFHVDVLKMK